MFIDATASMKHAVQAEWWLCDRISARLYLAVHPRTGRYPLVVQYCGERCLVKCEWLSCSLTICRSLRLYYNKQKLCVASVFHIVIHTWSVFIHLFLHCLPYPPTYPLGNAWNACFFCFACPMLRIVIKKRET